MDEQPETTTPGNGRHSFKWNFFVWSVFWPFVIFILYALSYGPIEKRQETVKGASYLQFSAGRYVPLGWVYRHTPLHKPLGMYYHLWLPKYFDAKGDLTGVVS